MLYHPSQQDLIPKIKQLGCAVDHLLLVDNTETGTPWLSDRLSEEEQHANMTYFPLLENVGIASAQNRALEYAFVHFQNEDKILFFDQDSSIPMDLPRRLAQSYDQLALNDRVAAIGPSFTDEKRGFVYPQVAWNNMGLFQRFTPDQHQKAQKVAALISSGMLTNIQTLKNIGLYDDALFIDYVDTDWCLKAQSKGYTLYVIPNISMTHAIGINSIKLLGRYFTVHSPIRRYYMLRNSFLMAKKEYVKSALAFTFIFRTSLHHILLILFCDHKWKNCIAFYKGFLDGYLNKIENHSLISKCLKIKQK